MSYGGESTFAIGESIFYRELAQYGIFEGVQPYRRGQGLGSSNVPWGTGSQCILPLAFCNHFLDLHLNFLVDSVCQLLAIEHSSLQPFLLHQELWAQLVGIASGSVRRRGRGEEERGTWKPPHYAAQLHNKARCNTQRLYNRQGFLPSPERRQGATSTEILATSPQILSLDL